MTNLGQLDLMVEMIDLCQHLLGELRHHLSYFKASVYKVEAQEFIDSKIQILAILLQILGDEHSKDLLDDFCAVSSPMPHSPPGECSFSLKLGILLSGLDEALKKFYNQITLKATAMTSPDQLTQSIRQNKCSILKVCKEDSKQYEIFQGI